MTLEIVGLEKAFGRLEVLRGIDLTVAEHEVVCLIGASGSGKSTLLRAAMGQANDQLSVARGELTQAQSRLTQVRQDPSSMAASKSWLMPIDNSRSRSGGAPA